MTTPAAVREAAFPRYRPTFVFSKQVTEIKAGDTLLLDGSQIFHVHDIESEQLSNGTPVVLLVGTALGFNRMLRFPNDYVRVIN